MWVLCYTCYMKTRLNKTGNTKGETIYITKLVNYEGEQVEITGTYLSIDDKGYISYSTLQDEIRWAHYKDCYRRKQEEIF